MSKRDVYIAKVKMQLDELNAKLSELEAKAKAAKADRDKYREDMAKLRQHSDRAVAKLAELQSAGEGAWEGMVAEMKSSATPSRIRSTTSSPSSEFGAFWVALTH